MRHPNTDMAPALRRVLRGDGGLQIVNDLVDANRHSQRANKPVFRPEAEHGELYNSVTLPITIGAGATAHILSFNANGASSGTTPDHAADKITIDTAGTFLTQYSISAFKSAPINATTREAEFWVAVNGVKQANLGCRFEVEDNETNATSTGGFVALAVGDELKIYIHDLTGASYTLSVAYNNLNCLRLL